MTNNREYFKMVLLGDKSIGKTCIANRYFCGKFDTNEKSTIGAAFQSKIFTIDGTEYEMGLWDTTGEEKYRSICSLYYRDAVAAIICYDVTVRNSFHKLNYWMNELHKFEESCQLYICATKSDLLETYEADPKLSYVESYAKQHGAKFFLTSSKTGENIDKLFDTIMEDYVLEIRKKRKRFSNTIKLSTNKKLHRRGIRKCCSNH